MIINNIKQNINTVLTNRSSRIVHRIVHNRSVVINEKVSPGFLQGLLQGGHRGGVIVIHQIVLLV